MPAVFVPGVNVPDEPPVKDEGPLHVPPAFGVPPKTENKFIADPSEQTETEALVPVLGAVVTETVTVAVALEQGADPVTVYVYVPAVLVPGVNVPFDPPVRTEGPDQVPIA